MKTLVLSRSAKQATENRRRQRFSKLFSSWRSDKGTSSIEFAFVTPFLVLLVAGIIQFGLMMYLQNNMINVASETVRRLAIGDLTTVAQAQQFARDRLINWGVTFTIVPTLADPLDPNDTDYIVDISVPMDEACIIDPFDIVTTGILRAVVTMREE